MAPAGLINEVPIILRNTLPYESNAQQIIDALVRGMWAEIEARGEERVRVYIGELPAHLRMATLHEVFTWLIGPQPK